MLYFKYKYNHMISTFLNLAEKKYSQSEFKKKLIEDNLKTICNSCMEGVMLVHWRWNLVQPLHARVQVGSAAEDGCVVRSQPSAPSIAFVPLFVVASLGKDQKGHMHPRSMRKIN